MWKYDVTVFFLMCAELYLFLSEIYIAIVCVVYVHTEL